MAAMDVCCDSDTVGNGSVSTIDTGAMDPWGGAMLSMLSDTGTIVFMDTDTDGVMPRLEDRFGACCASSVAKRGCIACWDITSSLLATSSLSCGKVLTVVLSGLMVWAAAIGGMAMADRVGVMVGVTTGLTVTTPPAAVIDMTLADLYLAFYSKRTSFIATRSDTCFFSSLTLCRTMAFSSSRSL